MFKRANKITALLVAAASMMSVVPAMASDYKKVDSQDGIVYGAVAYKDGQALIDGEVDGNDGAYYLADGKYTELDDVDSGSDYFAYGDKYAKVNADGDYFVDLTSGSVTDESVDENDVDDAASALRKKAKDVDRYNNDTSTIADLKLISGNKFADSWYEVDTTSANKYTIVGYAGNGSNEVVNAGNVTPNIYTDKSGNYIDADYNLGKIKVETTKANATIENSVDKEDLIDATAGTTSTYAEVAAVKTLGQDADYIYRYAEITVNVVGAGNANLDVKINNKHFTTNATGQVMLPVIQKISKAQASDDIEEAKYAKTVYNYVISDDSAVLDGTTTTGNIGFIKNDAEAASVIGGKLVAYDTTSTLADTVQVQAMTLKQKNGYYYTDLEDRATETPEYSTDLGKTAVDTDVDGNIYVLDGGYVKEFDGTDDWNKVYKVDGSFDSLSVYDKDNMVAWSQGDEIYSVIGGKTTDTTTEPTTPVVTAGWAQAANGAWTYNKADGTKATGWLLDGATWYYLKADGVMATGWVQDGATWYYTNASGAMQTGWINDNGTWYYTNASGAMLANTTVDGYVLGASGAWVK